MSGSAGFLSMEVKLDLDNAEKGLRDLAKFAKSELGKPIKIDDTSFKGMAATLAALEGTYADTLAIVTRMNASTANLARSTRSVADAAKYAAESQRENVQVLKEAERTERARLDLAKEQVKASGAVAAAEATSAGKLAYLDKQVEATEQARAAKREVVSLEQQHKAVIKEAADAQKEATRAVADAKKAVVTATRDLESAEKGVTKEREKQQELLGEQAKKVGLFRAGLVTATAGVDWGVTAVGAAQARNYGYALGAVAQMGKAAAASLRGMSVATAGTVAGVAAIAVAAVGAAAAVGTLAAKVSRMGTQEAIGMESLVNQLNAMMPTAQMARQEIEGLFELGTRTIAPTTTLIELDRRLLMAGGSAAILRQQVLEGFGAFSTAAGLTTEQMNSLNYLIGEVTLKGRLMRTEMTTQFSSAGLSSAGFLEATARETGIAVDELNQKLSEGTFNSEMFVQGLIAYFNQYEGAAQQAATSVSALMANTRDAISAGLAQAFYSEGVTTALSRLWQMVQGLVARLRPAFSAIGASVANFFATLSSGLEGIGKSGGGNAVVFLFGRVLPAAINAATAAVRWLLDGLAIIWPIVTLAAKAVMALVNVLAAGTGQVSAFKVAFVGVAAVVGVVVGALRILAGYVQASVFLMRALVSAISLDFGGAANNFASAIGAVASGYMDAKNAAVSFGKAVASSGKAVGKVKAPDLTDTGRTPPNPLGEGAGRGRPSGGGDAAKKSSAAARDVANALASLYDQTRRWLGQRSELEKSLTGGAEGFTASADQIIDAGVNIVKTLDKAGYSGKSRLVAFVKREVMALAKLAQQRDALQKRLEEQQDSLAQLQNDRSSMSRNIAQNLNAFVWALQTESETLTEYTRLDSVGSFTLVSRKVTKSWVASLKERLDATRKFIANIRALRNAGLNPETVRQLVEAGPEAAAAAVAELTAGGQQTVDEVNAIQQEMLALSTQFGDEQASNYYDVGIAAAQALVAGTQAALSAITAQGEAISGRLQDALAAIGKPAADAGAAAGGAYGGALKDAITGSLAGFSPSLPAWDGGGLGSVDFGEMFTGVDYAQIGRDIIGGVVGGISSGLSSAWETVKGWWNTYIVAPFRNYFGINSPSTLMFGFGGDIVQGLINGITNWFTNNPVLNFFKNAFTSALTWLGTTLPREVGNAAGDAWDKLKSGFPDLKGWIEDKSESAIDWLRGRGRYAGGGLPGAVRGALSAITSNLDAGGIADKVKSTFKSAVNQILRAWNNLRITFPSWSFSVLGRRMNVGGWTVNTPDVPLLAAGGVTTRPMLAGIGERGSEAVLPLTNPRAMAKIADAIAGAGGPGSAPQVRVFIGDRELTDIVRVEMREAGSRQAARVYAGRGV